MANLVKIRVRRHRRARRTAFAGGPFLMLLAALALAPLLLHREEALPAPQMATAQAPHRGIPASVPPADPALQGRIVPSPVDPSPVPGRVIPRNPEVILAKADQGVAVRWEGAENEEYVVYRCTTPLFDACSMATEVRGTAWIDDEPDGTPVVFYKVELKGRA